ncbi:MAG: septal ring lytic transglycosylase RlpA family protein [Lautropia sp.]
MPLLLIAACSTTAPPAPSEPTPAPPAPERIEPTPIPPQATPPVLRKPPSARRGSVRPPARPSVPREPAAQPDADDDDEVIAGPEPRLEPLATYANRSYRIRGRTYQPMTELRPFRQRGVASWYGVPFHGRKTATGERFDMNAMSAAHPTLPLPCYVKVRNLKTGAAVIVRVNDRGPFADGRIIDLSRAAATQLGFAEGGVVAVEIELIVPDGDAGMATTLADSR